MNLICKLLGLIVACILVACTSPWGGDVGCLTLASYAERVECQSKVQRTISGDEEIRRKVVAPASIQKTADIVPPVAANGNISKDATDPICYTKAGPGEKPCAK